MNATRVAIGILTYRRPDRLAASLPLVLRQADEVAPGADVTVIVIDNDPGGSARDTVADFHHPRLRYVCEPTPGIAAARNRALDEAADFDCLAFIDDDERPEPEWLSSLLGTWRDTGATAVMGRVISLFEHELSPFVEAGDFFWRPRMPSGTPIEVAAAGNLLLDMTRMKASGVRFDERLALGGGEDTLLSRALRRKGHRMVWCDESAAVDFVPRERTTRRWVLTRAWSHGNTSVRVDAMLAGSKRARLGIRLRSAVKGATRVAGGAARFTWGLVSRSWRHKARGLRAVWRGAGMLTASTGRYYSEYARPRE